MNWVSPDKLKHKPELRFAHSEVVREPFQDLLPVILVDTAGNKNIAR